MTTYLSLLLDLDRDLRLVGRSGALCLLDSLGLGDLELELLEDLLPPLGRLYFLSLPLAMTLACQKVTFHIHVCTDNI